MIHIAYALSDAQGIYSKFVGASICSVLMNTTEKVTIHVLHDGTLTEDNRCRFVEMVRTAGDEVLFYDVPSRLEATMEEGRKILPEGMDSSRYTGANIYRLLLPEVLPLELDKVIFLDADTIVNLDIAELWAEETGEAGLAAVPDYDVLEHFGKSDRIRPNDSFLYKEGFTDVHGIFNAGVLLMGLDILRQRESLLLSGFKFLRDHGGKWDFYDNDILIGFFAKTYRHLPWCFQVRLDWALAFGENKVEEAIYHYVDRNYSLNPGTGLHTLFLHYLLASPWGGEEALCRLYQSVGGMSLQLVQERLRKIRSIENAARGKKRVFMGMKEDEARLRRDFELGPKELYLPLAPGGKISLPGDVDSHYYMVFWSNYQEVKGILIGMGLQEYRDFADGTLLMPERTNDIFPDGRNVIWGM